MKKNDYIVAEKKILKNANKKILKYREIAHVAITFCVFFFFFNTSWLQGNAQELSISTTPGRH